MTDLSKTQLATILSALDGERRSPANKDAALKAIGSSAERLGLTADSVLAAAPGLLDGRLDAAAWRAQLTEPEVPPRRRLPTPTARPGHTSHARARAPRRRCDRHVAAARGRHCRPGDRGHRLAAAHGPRRDQRGAQEEARAAGHLGKGRDWRAGPPHRCRLSLTHQPDLTPPTPHRRRCIPFAARQNGAGSAPHGSQPCYSRT